MRMARSAASGSWAFSAAKMLSCCSIRLSGGETLLRVRKRTRSGGLNMFDGFPCQTAVDDLRNGAVKLVVQQQEFLRLLASRRQPLALQIMFQQRQVTRGGDHGGAAHNGSFYGFTDK